MILILVNKLRCKKCGEEIERTYPRNSHFCKRETCAIIIIKPYMHWNITRRDCYALKFWSQDLDLSTAGLYSGHLQ